MAKNLDKVMKWKQAVADFREYYMPGIVLQEQANGFTEHPDWTMRREAWNNYTDYLCKSHMISDWQYEWWGQPACVDPDAG